MWTPEAPRLAVSGHVVWPWTHCLRYSRGEDCFAACARNGPIAGPGVNIRVVHTHCFEIAVRFYGTNAEKSSRCDSNFYPAPSPDTRIRGYLDKMPGSASEIGISRGREFLDSGFITGKQRSRLFRVPSGFSYGIRSFCSALCRRILSPTHIVLLRVAGSIRSAPTRRASRWTRWRRSCAWACAHRAGSARSWTASSSENVPSRSRSVSTAALGSVLGSWVGVRRLFHLSSCITAARMVLLHDLSTDAADALHADGRHAHAHRGSLAGRAPQRGPGILARYPCCARAP